MTYYVLQILSIMQKSLLKHVLPANTFRRYISRIELALGKKNNKKINTYLGNMFLMVQKTLKTQHYHVFSLYPMC